MRVRSLLVCLLVPGLTLGLHAQRAPVGTAPVGSLPGGGSMRSVAGDHPLTTIETYDGNFHGRLLVNAHAGVTSPTGAFSIGSIPSFSTVSRVYFYATSFNDQPSEMATLTFDGTVIGPQAPDDEDVGGSLPGPMYTCRMYRFDITSLIVDNGIFNYSVSGITAAFGEALVIVYENPSFPVRHIVINDGAENLLSGTTTMSFDGMSAGLANLQLFVVADEVGGTETLSVNGAVVAGPGDICAANRGPNASLLDVPVTSIDGTNSVSLATTSDWIGVHVSLLISPFQCPSYFLNYGVGHPGTLGVPSLTSSNVPNLGTTITVDAGNSQGVDTFGLLIYGFRTTSLVTSRDGTLLVEPFGVRLVTVPAAGIQLPFIIPNQLQLCGFPLFVQMLQLDGGASRGMSFTDGLELGLGLP